MRRIKVSFPTDLAKVRFLTCVGSHVDYQVTIESESSLTCSTSIWLLARVDSHVDQQGTSASETFPTCFARIWLLTCVDSYVNVQC